MPFFTSLSSVTGKNAYSLFEIRLENDFVVFRGDVHESAAQIVKGTVVLCLSAPLRVDDVHLQLIGTERLNWTDSRITPTGVANQKIDRSNQFFTHRWEPFVGGGTKSAGSKSITLDEGNYEWPFEVTLPGDTCESVEGLGEASITYYLKATIARGKLAYDFHARKRLRVIRTLESSALEFLHAMSVENIWPNKVEYSLVIPQKAVVFGSAIPLESRFTPLLKGLEIGDITCKLVECSEITLKTAGGYLLREHKRERDVKSWTIPVNKEEHWHDMLGETGQEGWQVDATLDLPRRLGKCIQDTNVHGIKVRHKLKLVAALHNPDGHVSELRATLPVTIFISPNMPLDEEGNLLHSLPAGTGQRVMNIAPPGYGEHVLDQLYDDIEPGALTSGTQTPATQSGFNSPMYTLSRSGSSENLAASTVGTSPSQTGVAAAALSHRLQNVSLDPSRRNESYGSLNAVTASRDYNYAAAQRRMAASSGSSPEHSPPLTRSNSAEQQSGVQTPEHVELDDLSRVPSYATAVKTPSRPASTLGGAYVPHYAAALSAPTTPPLHTANAGNPLASIAERRGSEQTISGMTLPGVAMDM